jgi:hypothetical protein
MKMRVRVEQSLESGERTERKKREKEPGQREEQRGRGEGRGQTRPQTRHWGLRGYIASYVGGEERGA